MTLAGLGRLYCGGPRCSGGGGFEEVVRHLAVRERVGGGRGLDLDQPGRHDHVVGWGPGTGKSYATIVAAQDGTHVEVQPTVGTNAGPGIPPGVAGGVFSFDLDEGDVAQVAVTTDGTALTGTRIEADAPIGVFTGHECAFVPAELYACDHLEEQIAGLRLWGTSFAASRVPPRHPSDPEDSRWQIYASEDDTTITFEAPVPVTGLPASPLVLDAGESLEFFAGGPPAAPGDFYVEADKPIAVFDYMTGWEHLGEQIGDPAMLQLTPTEQSSTATWCSCPTSGHGTSS